MLKQRFKTKGEIQVFLKEIEEKDIIYFQELYAEFPQEYLEFALALRDALLEQIFQKGDVGNTHYLLLYLLYSPLRGVILAEERLKPFLQTARKHFLLEGLGDLENLMLLELEVLCLIIDGRSDEGIKRYIQGISQINLHAQGSEVRAEFIRTYFPKMRITMEQFLDAIKEILQAQYYNTLPLERRRSILNWQLHCFWNTPTFFNHRSWLELYVFWRELFYFHLQPQHPELMDHALYMQFFIYHLCGNSFSTQAQWREFVREIDLVGFQAYCDFSHSLPPATPQKEGKIIIAFLRDRIVENSPYKVEYSFFKQLLAHAEFREKYTLKIYLMSLLEKSENSLSAMQSYQDLGIEIFDVGSICNQRGFYNSHLQKAMLLREKMIEDGVGVLISPNNGYGISDFLIASRSAPVQIFWSHGNFVYDLPYLDAKITHICGNELSVIHEGYEFVGIPVVMDQSFYNPPISPDRIAFYRKQFPQDRVILGTIGRLTKIDSWPYLSMLVRIMHQFPNTIYLACGNGNEEEIKSKLKHILLQDYESFMQRFYFCGYVNNVIFGHIIDFWLDSFPMEQGESRIEYVAKGKLSLVLVKDPSKVQKDWITMAVDEEDYYQKALHLLSLNKTQQQDLINKIQEGLARYHKKREELGVKSMMDSLETLCKNF